MTKNISITLEEEQLKYLDDLADMNGRSRSGMISWLIRKSQDEDEALQRESEYYDELEESKKWQRKQV